MRQVHERRCLLRNRLGLHLRTAGLLAHTAARFRSKIQVCHEGREVNAEDIMELLMLAAGRGVTLRLRAEGPDAEEAVEAVAELIATRFGEQA